jgi:hypothetical protein
MGAGARVWFLILGHIIDYYTKVFLFPGLQVSGFASYRVLVITDGCRWLSPALDLACCLRQMSPGIHQRSSSKLPHPS